MLLCRVGVLPTVAPPMLPMVAYPGRSRWLCRGCGRDFQLGESAIAKLAVGAYLSCHASADVSEVC